MLLLSSCYLVWGQVTRILAVVPSVSDAAVTAISGCLATGLLSSPQTSYFLLRVRQKNNNNAKRHNEDFYNVQSSCVMVINESNLLDPSLFFQSLQLLPSNNCARVILQDPGMCD